MEWSMRRELQRAVTLNSVGAVMLHVGRRIVSTLIATMGTAVQISASVARDRMNPFGDRSDGDIPRCYLPVRIVSV
jgi:hypothetical protein